MNLNVPTSTPPIQIRGLSMTQPWATLVALGLKTIETRSWYTRYRGPLAIHAALGVPEWAREYGSAFEVQLQTAGYSRAKDLPRGVIVAVCNLVACKIICPPSFSFPEVQSPNIMHPPAEPERSYGDYTPYRYGWLLKDVVQLVEPIKAKGAPRLWTPTGDVARRLEEVLGLSQVSGALSMGEALA